MAAVIRHLSVDYRSPWGARVPLDSACATRQGPCPAGRVGWAPGPVVARGWAALAVASVGIRRGVRRAVADDVQVAGPGDLPERRLRGCPQPRGALPPRTSRSGGDPHQLPLVHDSLVRAADPWPAISP